MRSTSSQRFFEQAVQLTDYLHRITITDPVLPNHGRNTTEMSYEDRINSMETVIAAIKYGRATLQGSFADSLINQDKEYWIARGKSTYVHKNGNSFDCAAAVANLMLQIVDHCIDDARIEIITVQNTHAFVVINRRQELEFFQGWGEDSFIVDIWFSNQFPKFYQASVFWADDVTHPINHLIMLYIASLTLVVTINEGGPKYIINPLVAITA
ncbi:MAG: hypothetical protein KAH18_00875 [Psychromonas sp.]|nr:hypothetical protein [Psychromonas sp.]